MQRDGLSQAGKRIQQVTHTRKRDVKRRTMLQNATSSSDITPTLACQINLSKLGKTFSQSHDSPIKLQHSTKIK